MLTFSRRLAIEDFVTFSPCTDREKTKAKNLAIDMKKFGENDMRVSFRYMFMSTYIEKVFGKKNTDTHRYYYRRIEPGRSTLPVRDGRARLRLISVPINHEFPPMLPTIDPVSSNIILYLRRDVCKRSFR